MITKGKKENVSIVSEFVRTRLQEFRWFADTNTWEINNQNPGYSSLVYGSFCYSAMSLIIHRYPKNDGP